MLFLDINEAHIRVGDTIVLEPARREEAEIAANRREHCKRPSNTRNAGSNLESHRKGTMSEQAMRQYLRIKRGPPAYDDGPDKEPDITETIPPIEVKCGIPVEKITGLNPKALYVVLKGAPPYTKLMIERIAMGSDILRLRKNPDRTLCPRGNSCKENYLIPEKFTEFVVNYK